MPTINLNSAKEGKYERLRWIPKIATIVCIQIYTIVCIQIYTIVCIHIYTNIYLMKMSWKCLAHCFLPVVLPFFYWPVVVPVQKICSPTGCDDFTHTLAKFFNAYHSMSNIVKQLYQILVGVFILHEQLSTH